MQGGTSREEGDSARGRGGPEPVLWEAVLRAVGRFGFENMSVQAVLDETGIARATFYRRFRNLDECFGAAYEWKIEQLCEEILRAGRGGASWAAGLRRALSVLLDFVAEHPHTANVLLIEGERTGSPTAAMQNSVLKRLARALESARRQPGSRHSAPPLTADLIVGAITNTLQGLLVKGEPDRAPKLLGELTYLVMLAFFDEETAFEEMDSADEEAV